MQCFHIDAKMVSADQLYQVKWSRSPRNLSAYLLHSIHVRVSHQRMVLDRTQSDFYHATAMEIVWSKGKNILFNKDC